MKNLKHIKGLDQLPETLTDDWVKIAIEKVDTSQMTLDQRMFFEMMLARNASIIEMRKDEIKEAVERAKKKAERKNILEIAKKFKALGGDNEINSKATGLSIEEIESL